VKCLLCVHYEEVWSKDGTKGPFHTCGHPIFTAKGEEYSLTSVEAHAENPPKHCPFGSHVDDICPSFKVLVLTCCSDCKHFYGAKKVRRCNHPDYENRNRVKAGTESSKLAGDPVDYAKHIDPDCPLMDLPDPAQEKATTAAKLVLRRTYLFKGRKVQLRGIDLDPGDCLRVRFDNLDPNLPKSGYTSLKEFQKHAVQPPGEVEDGLDVAHLMVDELGF